MVVRVLQVWGSSEIDISLYFMCFYYRRWVFSLILPKTLAINKEFVIKNLVGVFQKEKAQSKCIKRA